MSLVRSNSNSSTNLQSSLIKRRVSGKSLRTASSSKTKKADYLSNEDAIKGLMQRRYDQELDDELTAIYQENVTRFSAKYILNQREFKMWIKFIQALILDDMVDGKISEKIDSFYPAFTTKQPQLFLSWYVSIISAKLHNQSTAKTPNQYEPYRVAFEQLSNTIFLANTAYNEEELIDLRNQLFDDLFIELEKRKFKVACWYEKMLQLMYEKAISDLESNFDDEDQNNTPDKINPQNKRNPLYAKTKAFMDEVERIYKTNYPEIPSTMLIRSLNAITDLIQSPSVQTRATAQQLAEAAAKWPKARMFAWLMLGVIGTVGVTAAVGVSIFSLGLAAPILVAGVAVSATTLQATAVGTGVVATSTIIYSAMRFFKAIPKNTLGEKIQNVIQEVNINNPIALPQDEKKAVFDR